MSIAPLVTLGCGSFGSIHDIVTCGYQAGAAIVTNRVQWSARPGAAQRRKHKPHDLRLVAANDAALEESNREWDELKKLNDRRRAAETARKANSKPVGAKDIVAQAKRIETQAHVPRTTEPKAPKIAPPKVSRDVSKPVPAAPPPAAAVTARQQKAPAVTAASPVVAPATPPPLDLSAFGLDERTAAALTALAAHLVGHYEHHRQAAETARRAQQEAAKRSAQETARQKQIVAERLAWQRRVDQLLKASAAVGQRIDQRQGNRRSSSSIRLRH